VPLIPQLKASIKPDDSADKSSRAFEFALPVLARAAPEVARPTVTEYLSSESLMLMRGAREALAVLAGVEDARGVVVRKLRGKDRGYHFEKLSEPQKIYWIAYQVDEQVTSNGFSGYFSNPSGRHANEAPAALEAIGAPKSAQLMRWALEIGPRESEESQRDRGSLDSQYYALKDEDILGLLVVYAARYSEHFR
jgi:hypothetical protein